MTDTGQLGATTAAGAAVTTSIPKNKPSNPNMGTCEETYAGSSSYYLVFGGKPKPDWTGIEDITDRTMSDLCFRSLDPVAGQKSTYYRTKGITTKFEAKDSLNDFQRTVWDHLIKYGLDTISYLPDPKDTAKVLCTVNNHAQFTGDMILVETLSAKVFKNYDIWDKKHDIEAKEFLLSSLSPELKKDFEPFYDRDKDTFSMTWLRLVHYLVSSNSKTFDKLKDNVRKTRPQQYSGQNIEKMSADYMKIGKELENAGYFDHSLVLNMVDGFLCASKDEKGTFHYCMNDLRRKVDKIQRETIFMSKTDQANYYAKEKLTYKDVCFSAVKEYKTLCDENMWEPKKLPKDRHGPAKQTINLATIKEAYNLVANMSPRHNEQKNNNNGDKYKKQNGNKLFCHNCGKKGHFSKDCTEHKRTEEERKDLRHKNLAPWQLKAPSSKEGHSKVVNKRTYHWCAKCENWTSTHNTQTHGKGRTFTKNNNQKFSNNKKKTTFAPETNLTSFEPEAWLLEFEKPSRNTNPFSILNLIKYIYFVLTLAILLGLPIPNYTQVIDTLLQTTWTQETILNTLVSTLDTITHHIKMYQVILGPLCWIITGYLACKIPAWYTPQFDPVLLQPEPRSRRRQSRSRSTSHSRHKIGSAYDYNLTPKYPLRLRNENRFNTRSSTPTKTQRHIQSNLDSWIQGCSPSNNKYSHSTRTPKLHNPYTSFSNKSKGGSEHRNKSARKNKNQKGSRHLTATHITDFLDFYQNPQSPQQERLYTPTGIHTSRDKPNRNMTVKQHKKLRKIAHSVLLTDADLNTQKTAKLVSLLAPHCFRTSLSEKKHGSLFPIVWDSGASVCVTPARNDFVDYESSTNIGPVKGVGGNSTAVIGQGHVEWSIYDSNGLLRKLKLPAYHIPNCKTRLISTTSLLNTYQGEHIIINGNSLKLSGIEGDPDRSQVIVFNNPTTHLPTTTAFNPDDIDIPGQVLYSAVTTVSKENHNLSEAQKELLRWHQRLGHLDFNKIKHLLRTGVLSHTEGSRTLHTAASKVKYPPKCAACLYGKQTIRTAPGKIIKIIKDQAGTLRTGNLLPGQEVSVDHFISSVRGRLFKGYNKGSIEDRYVGGCIFVDHASSHIHVEFQSSLSSHETLTAKIEYEKLCRDVGVIPQKYVSDNGRSFASREFSEHLSNFYQIIKFAGVGAHHHNAQAERAIRTIMTIARTMMIHGGIYWPDVADSTLWPMAVKHACFLYNHVPSHVTGLSPSDIFSRIRWPQKKFLDLHVWGCPVYVLEKSLQDGKKIPKWRPRSNRSIYMGISNKHASTVPLVLSTSTGAITPQFHIVFDDWFATIGANHDELPDFSSDEWNKMFGDSTYQYITEEIEDEDNREDLLETMRSQIQADLISDAQDKAHPPVPLDPEEPTNLANPTTEEREVRAISDNQTKHPTTTTKEQRSEDNYKQETIQKELSPQRKQPSPKKRSPIHRKTGIERLDLGPRRSRRSTKPAEKFTYTHDKSSLTRTTNETANLIIQEQQDANVYMAYITPDCHILLASAKANNPDIFSYDEAMGGEYKSEWIQAANKEVTALEKLDCWTEVPMNTATTKVLPGTWVFKVKRAPDGTFKKFKARYCIRGDLQEGDFETYAPVVSFSSVRLFLAWSLMLGWYTCSIDFSNAFIQATLKDPTFIHLPRGFHSNESEQTCLKLKKSLYGLSVAPRLWYQHLWNALKELGLVASKHDACLLLRKDLIVICYVDDLGIQAPTKDIVDQLIKQLRDKGFDLTFEGTFSEYLGIQYTTVSDNEIKMTQEGLIKKIIEATGLEECSSNKTPSTKEALGSDIDGEPMTDEWNYRSVIGMLLYLSTNTRPDIAYAVSQVARFSHNPKKSHATAVKMIIRYLSGSKNQGVTYKRPNKLCVDCYVDADFAGLYRREPPENPTSVKSRTGYIISVGGCYITCKSQLQSTIALSTSEAEYGALSQAMRTLIPIRETLLEIIKTVDMVDATGKHPFGNRTTISSFQTVVHEDNSAALGLAVNQKVTSRTKHWCVKFHFFWSYVNNKQNNTSCVKVDTKEQKADYLTKGLTKDVFENCRFLNQGW